ncbi:hypothetical protein L9F63_007748, partial [Diploptera punctata]
YTLCLFLVTVVTFVVMIGNSPTLFSYLRIHLKKADFERFSLPSCDDFFTSDVSLDSTFIQARSHAPSHWIAGVSANKEYRRYYPYSLRTVLYNMSLKEYRD